MKKIITTTFFDARNYGAVLQAYALQRKLLQLSNEKVDCKILNLSKDEHKIFNKIRLSVDRGNIVGIYSNLMVLLHIKKYKALVHKFDSFIKDNMKLTEQYNNYDEVVKNPPDADLYITGSDQVWNICFGLIKPYVLEFVKNGKKISYAASMGSSNKQSKDWDKLSENIKHFSCISVREEKTRELLEKELKRNVRVDVDPVFLLNKCDWNTLLLGQKDYSKNIKGKYILCFMLLRHDLFGSVVKKMRKMTGLPVYSIVIHPAKGGYGNVLMDVGPIDFINLIKNAEYIITTSFHGTAFSILFNKKFFVLNNKSPERISNLLDICGINSRMINDIDGVNKNEIDYTSVNHKLNNYIKNSEEYLISTIDALMGE